MKTLYAVGAGPGDPELLTLKAARILRSCDVVFTADKKGRRMAEQVLQAIAPERQSVPVAYPMGEMTPERYRENLEQMARAIPEGGTGALLILGDPLFYSTWCHTMEQVVPSGLHLLSVAGIPSFLEAAHRGGMPLVTSGETLAVCDHIEQAMALLEKADVVVVLKTKGKSDKAQLVAAARACGKHVLYAEDLCGEGECLLRDDPSMLKREAYMSLMILGAGSGRGGGRIG